MNKKTGKRTESPEEEQKLMEEIQEIKDRRDLTELQQEELISQKKD